MPMMPYVNSLVNDKVQITDLYSSLLENRIIFLAEEITDFSANLIIAQMLYLEAKDPSKDIYLYINSPGGSVSAGLAIYDTMQHIKCDVSTICMGTAASMGAFILSSGAKNKRLALPHAKIMIHQPLGNIAGQVTDMKIHLDHAINLKNELNLLLAKNTGQSIETISEDCERDKYMSSLEAKNYGLIDQVIERS